MKQIQENKKILSNKPEYIDLRQNEQIISIIKLLINAKAEGIRIARSGADTLYVNEKGYLMRVKNFSASKLKKSKFTSDRHLKMLLYLLSHHRNSKSENLVKFKTSEFNKACSLTKDTKTNRLHAELLNDLCTFTIAYVEENGKLAVTKRAQEILDSRNITDVTFKPLFLNKSDTLRIVGAAIENTDIDTIDDIDVIDEKSSTRMIYRQSEIEIDNSLTQGNAGIMYIHRDIFKIKSNRKVELGAVAIAFNIYYTRSVGKGVVDECVYNASKVLEWIGITEEVYYDFFEAHEHDESKKKRKESARYYVRTLERAFKGLENVKIYGEVIYNTTDYEDFYKNAKVKFDLKHLADFMRSRTNK